MVCVQLAARRGINSYNNTRVIIMETSLQAAHILTEEINGIYECSFFFFLLRANFMSCILCMYVIAKVYILSICSRKTSLPQKIYCDLTNISSISI